MAAFLCCCLGASLLATSTWERCSTAVWAARGTRLFTDEAADARRRDHERLCAAAARPVLGTPPAGQAIHAQRFGWQPRNSCGVPSPEKPCQPSGTHPCAAAHGSSGARGCSGSPPLAASPSAALCHSRACTGVRVIRRRDATNRDRNCANLQPRQQFAGQHTPKASHLEWPEGANAPVTQPQPGAAGGSTTPRKR